MSVFQHDCPHCGTKSVAFSSFGATAVPGQKDKLWNVFATCGKCGFGVIGMVVSSGLHPHIENNMNLHPGSFNLVKLFPPPEQPEAPEFLPDNVKKFFLQAAENRKTNHDAAGAMYRKSLDVGMKVKFPPDEFPDISGVLFNRIKKAAEIGAITKELGDWAHHIRLEGNDAVHDEDPYTEDEVAALHRFTELVLLYLFTLPGMLEAATKNPEPEAAASNGKSAAPG